MVIAVASAGAHGNLLDVYKRQNLLLEAIFPILHISYGVGTLKGLVEGKAK